MAYSLDLRQRAVKRVRNGYAVPETAALYEIKPRHPVSMAQTLRLSSYSGETAAAQA
jgi:hypothetical protein